MKALKTYLTILFVVLLGFGLLSVTVMAEEKTVDLSTYLWKDINVAVNDFGDMKNLECTTGTKYGNGTIALATNNRWDENKVAVVQITAADNNYNIIGIKYGSDETKAVNGLSTGWNQISKITIPGSSPEGVMYRFENKTNNHFILTLEAVGSKITLVGLSGDSAFDSTPDVHINIDTTDKIDCNQSDGVFTLDSVPLNVEVSNLAITEIPSVAKNVKMNISIDTGLSFDKEGKQYEASYTLNDLTALAKATKELTLYTSTLARGNRPDQLAINVTVTGDNFDTITEQKSITVSYSEQSAFVLGQDNLSWNNIKEDNAPYETGMYEINPKTGQTYFDTLMEGQSNQVKSMAQLCMRLDFYGSCSGMSLVEVLNKYDRIDLKAYQDGITSLHELATYSLNPKTASLINYYHAMQLLPDSNINAQKSSEMMQQNNLTAADILIEAGKTAHEKGKPAQLGYSYCKEREKGSLISIDKWDKALADNQAKSYGHAVVIYDMVQESDGSYKFSICDPNENNIEKLLVISADKKTITLEGSGSQEFVFSRASNSMIENNKNTNFTLGIASRLEELDLVNIDGLDNNTTTTNYPAGKIQIRTFGAVPFSAMLSDKTEYKTFEEGPLSVLNAMVSEGGDMQYEIATNNVIKITPESTMTSSLDLATENTTGGESFASSFASNLAGGSIQGGNFESIIFDPEGKVTLQGNASEYEMGLTLDESLIKGNSVYYTTIVSGSKAKHVSLENHNKGVLLSGDDLSDITISGNNSNKKKVISFNTNEKKALIGEIDGELIASIDKDNDGEYETIIATSAISVTGIFIDKTSLSMKVGDSATLTAVITPENATNQVISWSSSDNTVATVTDGKVSATAEGKTTITATAEDGSYTATCEVTVTKGATSIVNSTGMVSVVNAGVNTGIRQSDISLYIAIGLALVGVILCSAYVVYCKYKKVQ